MQTGLLGRKVGIDPHYLELVMYVVDDWSPDPYHWALFLP
jgi:hypothetical protein